MILISDDPIIRCMEATGYPPWLCGGFGRDDGEEDCVNPEEVSDGCI